MKTDTSDYQGKGEIIELSSKETREKGDLLSVVNTIIITRRFFPKIIPLPQYPDMNPLTNLGITAILQPLLHMKAYSIIRCIRAIKKLRAIT